MLPKTVIQQQKHGEKNTSGDCSSGSSTRRFLNNIIRRSVLEVEVMGVDDTNALWNNTSLGRGWLGVYWVPIGVGIAGVVVFVGLVICIVLNSSNNFGYKPRSPKGILTGKKYRPIKFDTSGKYEIIGEKLDFETTVKMPYRESTKHICFASKLCCVDKFVLLTRQCHRNREPLLY